MMVLKVPTGTNPRVSKKIAKQTKKLHEKLCGKGSCEVVVLEEGMELYIVSEEGGNDWAGWSTLRNGPVNPGSATNGV